MPLPPIAKNMLQQAAAEIPLSLGVTAMTAQPGDKRRQMIETIPYDLGIIGGATAIRHFGPKIWERATALLKHASVKSILHSALAGAKGERRIRNLLRLVVGTTAGGALSEKGHRGQGALRGGLLALAVGGTTEHAPALRKTFQKLLKTGSDVTLYDRGAATALVSIGL